jgi:hypothetical protein
MRQVNEASGRSPETIPTLRTHDRIRHYRRGDLRPGADDRLADVFSDRQRTATLALDRARSILRRVNSE